MNRTRSIIDQSNDACATKKMGKVVSHLTYLQRCSTFSSLFTSAHGVAHGVEHGELLGASCARRRTRSAIVSHEIRTSLRYVAARWRLHDD